MIRKMLNDRKLPPLKSREEMCKILIEEEYGQLPPDTQRPEWETALIGKSFKLYGGKAICQHLTLTARWEDKSFSFPFWSTVPAAEGKHPFFIHLNFRDGGHDRYQPTEEIIDNGFGILNLCYGDISSDNDDFTNGLAGILYPDGKRGPHDAGKIAIWSWAIQRVMDYAETQANLDASCACVCGHSRLGKTALYTGMIDKRFTFTHSNNSGNCGAAISRDKEGERIGDITQRFPYWFTEDFAKYAHREHEMPFDQHYLIAAIAPRYVHISSATADQWADPFSEYLGAVAAADAFAGGFVHPDRLPEPEERFQKGDIGYYLRQGGHAFCRQDWHALMDFIRAKKA